MLKTLSSAAIVIGVLTFVLGAQKNRLIKMVLLSTNNICFGREKRKLIFNYVLLRPINFNYALLGPLNF